MREIVGRDGVGCHMRLHSAAATGLLLAASVTCDRAPATLHRPKALAFDAAGHLLVAGSRGPAILVLEPDGRLLRTAAPHGLDRGDVWELVGLTGLPGGGFAVVDLRDPSVAEGGDSQSVIKLYDSRGAIREVLGTGSLALPSHGLIAGIGAIPGGFVLAEAAPGTLYFTDDAGRPRRKLREVRGGPPLRSPESFRVVGDALWVAETNAHRVRRLTLDGQQTLSVGGEGRGPGQLRFPYAVDVSADGWFVVADLGNYRLCRFDLEGRFLDSIYPEPVRADVAVQLVDVAVGPDGLIYAADSKGDRILVLRPDGTVVRVIHDLR